MRTDVLASGLDILHADRIAEVCKKTVMTYSKSTHEEEVQIQLNKWAAEGKIQILKHLGDCEDMGKCIRLLTWIQPRNSDGGPLNAG